ncbi:ester cyclase [Kineococcus sp. SYSU DK005]|uniref:ester cyclase n=1 Tax=Kineococcus sp. SYSU DK005 TaxID=3383126 RepID=UPI003D7E2465
MIIGGDAIAARLTGRGTHTGPFSGIAPTGRRLSTQELVIYRVADGKIVHCWGDLPPRGARCPDRSRARHDLTRRSPVHR